MNFLGINSIFNSQGLKSESSSVISSGSEISSKRKSTATSSNSSSNGWIVIMPKFWFWKKRSSFYVRRISPLPKLLTTKNSKKGVLICRNIRYFYFEMPSWRSQAFNLAVFFSVVACDPLLWLYSAKMTRWAQKLTRVSLSDWFLDRFLFRFWRSISLPFHVKRKICDERLLQVLHSSKALGCRTRMCKNIKVLVLNWRQNLCRV